MCQVISFRMPAGVIKSFFTCRQFDDRVISFQIPPRRGLWVNPKNTLFRIFYSWGDQSYHLKFSQCSKRGKHGVPDYEMGIVVSGPGRAGLTIYCYSTIPIIFVFLLIVKFFQKPCNQTQFLMSQQM